MSGTAIRSGSSFLLKLVGYAVAIGGIAFGAAALMANAGELQVLFGVIAMGGLVLALVGGALIAIGALLGRGKGQAAAPSLSPEQQQLRDSQDFLAARSEKERG